MAHPAWRGASAMARPPIALWYVPVLRGIAGIVLALLCFAHSATASAFRTATFGGYILADGVLCALTVFTLMNRRKRTLLLPLLVGAVGAGFGLYLLSTPRVAQVALTLVMAAWGVTVGVIALDTGYMLYRSVPESCRAIARRSGILLRRGIAMECGMLLAGAVALAFGVVALALAAAGIAVPLSLIALFAVTFGYLHLRVGLALGMLALTATDSEGSP
ncbi:MAG: DUF308 domain-containing protein, partial [Ktedonobacterales bacterium]